MARYVLVKMLWVTEYVRWFFYWCGDAIIVGSCENMLWVTKYVRDYSSIGCDDIKNAIQGTYQLKKYALIY